MALGRSMESRTWFGGRGFLVAPSFVMEPTAIRDRSRYCPDTPPCRRLRGVGRNAVRPRKTAVRRVRSAKPESPGSRRVGTAGVQAAGFTDTVERAKAAFRHAGARGHASVEWRFGVDRLGSIEVLGLIAPGDDQTRKLNRWKLRGRTDVNGKPAM